MVVRAGRGGFAAIRCISEAELRDSNGLVLIFFGPRASAREALPRETPARLRPGASVRLTG